ncbi:PX11C protein, partial [Calcarius ornatus]|nr:PX11C protein [Calcarius ornatus]
VRALSYGCQLAGAALPGPGALPGGLLAASAQLSSCRTALRLFDDLAMLRHSCSYGLGPEGEDALVRALSVLSNVANQLYYPCEHLAWAADLGIVRAASQRWWTRSTALWGSDLCNAIHWLPPGFLWAGRFPPWLVGLLGTISSLIGIYQASRGANSEAA